MTTELTDDRRNVMTNARTIAQAMVHCMLLDLAGSSKNDERQAHKRHVRLVSASMALWNWSEIGTFDAEVQAFVEESEKCGSKECVEARTWDYETLYKSLRAKAWTSSDETHDGKPDQAGKISDAGAALLAVALAVTAGKQKESDRVWSDELFLCPVGLVLTNLEVEHSISHALMCDAYESHFTKFDEHLARYKSQLQRTE